MVECELCGRQFKNPQGLRGHKTFYHGIRANHAKKIKPDHYREAEETKINEEQLNLLNRVGEMESTITELKETLEKWESYLALFSIEEQVEKHDRWLNPRGLHEAVIGLTGGPIADLEERLISVRRR